MSSIVEVIGITGPKYSGKSALADHIIEHAKTTYNRIGIRYSFAKPLKEVCHILFGGTESNWYGDFKNEIMENWASKLGEMCDTPRHIMQYVGTELFRENLHRNFWLMVAERYIDDIHKAENPDFIIVDDVRFDNEAEFIKGTYVSPAIVRIRRSHPKNFNADVDKHSSEWGIDMSLVDEFINCRSLEEIDQFAEFFCRRRWGNGSPT